VGTALDPAKVATINLPGIAIRTLWGKKALFAEQPGGKNLYRHVRNADRNCVPRGLGQTE